MTEESLRRIDAGLNLVFLETDVRQERAAGKRGTLPDLDDSPACHVESAGYWPNVSETMASAAAITDIATAA